jgi:hypothetical protein
MSATALRADQRGVALLADPIANKGTAFDAGERRALGLDGLLTPTVEALGQQALPLAAGLVAAGMRSPADFGAALIFRLVTFWLVALAGWTIDALLRRPGTRGTHARDGHSRGPPAQLQSRSRRPHGCPPAAVRSVSAWSRSSTSMALAVSLDERSVLGALAS